MERYGKKFKDLNKKEKLDYIIEYYKFHIIGGMIAMLVVFSGLNHYIFNPPKQVILDITITAPYMNQVGLEALQAELKDYVEAKVDKKTGQIDLLTFADQQDPQVHMAMTAKLVGKASVGEMDILILNEEHLKYFQDNHILQDLSLYISRDQMDQYGQEPVVDPRHQKQEIIAFKIRPDSKIGSLFPADFPAYFAIYTGARDVDLVKEVIPILF